jgi:UDP-4-amino-4,6-dideoxy-N-acetyl-beta-L-altrosamine transaminase
MIPYSRQNISRQDIKAVIKTLKSDFLTQGPVVPEFESAVAAYCGAQYGVATNSATSALHIALLVLDVCPGDRVWTSPNSFVASANSALYCGAQIDFVDIDAKTYNMSVDSLKEKLENAEFSGTLPKVLIPVHFGGQSCEMKEINELSIKYGFKVIEDASHALGGKYFGNKIGDCRYSDITIFSFHPVKMITTGEGGMAITNSQELADKMRLLRSHGIERSSEHFDSRAIDEIWNYQQIDLGFNYRMSDMNAALGLSQLSRLDNFISERNKIAHTYSKAVQQLGLVPQKILENIYSSYHLYPVRVKLSEFGKSQKFVYQELRAAGVEANVHYIPIHRHPYYENLGFKAGNFPQSEQLFQEVISLPVFPGLKKVHQTYVLNTIKEIYRR